MVYDNAYDQKFIQGYKERDIHSIIRVICHVCGRRWKHFVVEGEEFHSIPSDINRTLLVTCNLDIDPPIHSEKQISDSWRQLYTRQKQLGEWNKYGLDC